MIDKSDSYLRARMVAEALSWIGTPYKSGARIKGVGVNCAQLLYGVAKDAGAIPEDAPEPRWFTSQFALHQKDERIIDYIKEYGCHEISQSEVQYGDIVVYKTGKSHGHAAIIIDWPETIVHAMPHAGCQKSHARGGVLGGYTMRFFSVIKS
jgi:cell wall-associated NlpC family hydrolase